MFCLFLEKEIAYLFLGFAALQVCKLDVCYCNDWISLIKIQRD